MDDNNNNDIDNINKKIDSLSTNVSINHETSSLNEKYNKRKSIASYHNQRYDSVHTLYHDEESFSDVMVKLYNIFDDENEEMDVNMAMKKIERLLKQTLGHLRDVKRYFPIAIRGTCLFRDYAMVEFRQKDLATRFVETYNNGIEFEERQVYFGKARNESHKDWICQCSARNRRKNTACFYCGGLLKDALDEDVASNNDAQVVSLRVLSIHPHSLQERAVLEHLNKVARVKGIAISFDRTVGFVEFYNQDDAQIALRYSDSNGGFVDSSVGFRLQRPTESEFSAPLESITGLAFLDSHITVEPEPSPDLRSFQEPSRFETAGTAYMFDPNSGLYFDQNTSCYYNAITQLYYSCISLEYFRFNGTQFELVPPEQVAMVNTSGITDLSADINNVSFSIKKKHKSKMRSTVMANDFVNQTEELTSSAGEFQTQKKISLVASNLSRWQRPLVKYACLLCKRKFKEESNLKRHIEHSQMHAEFLKNPNMKRDDPESTPVAVKPRTSAPRNISLARIDDGEDRMIVDTNSKAAKFMKALGWEVGQSLGKTATGITVPLNAYSIGGRIQSAHGRVGLGGDLEQPDTLKRQKHRKESEKRYQALNW